MKMCSKLCHVLTVALGYLQGTLTPEECEASMQQLCESISPSVTEETVMVSIDFSFLFVMTVYLFLYYVYNMWLFSIC